MPLRDHFHPPVSKRASWEGFHGLWPGVIVQQLETQLPDGFIAEPRVHLGNYYEIDVSTYEDQAESRDRPYGPTRGSSAALAEAPQTAESAVALTFDVEFPEQYAYEVLVYDIERERRLVAALEIVSPANKDRPESRQLFVAKCFNLLRKDISLSIVDLVAIRQFNLYTELLALLNHRDPKFASAAPIYAATCRKRDGDGRTKLDTWAFPLTIGQPLPSLPIWLSATQRVMLNLETSYEETCRILRLV